MPHFRKVVADLAALTIPALFSGYNLWRPTLDASGWAVRPPGPNDVGGAPGEEVFVDAVGGNDAWPGTLAQPVQTAAGAFALVKTNNVVAGAGNHRIWFKRGQKHVGDLAQSYYSGGFYWPGGASESAPCIFGAYGTGADPIIVTPDNGYAWFMYGDATHDVWFVDLTFHPQTYQDWLDGVPGAIPSLGPAEYGNASGERERLYFENIRVEGYLGAHRFVSDSAADNRTRRSCMHRCHFSRLYNNTRLGPGGDVIKPGGIYNGGTRSMLFSECTFGEVGEWRTHPSGPVYGTPLDQNMYNVWDVQHTLALGCVFARSSHAGFQGRGSTASTYNCFVTECPVPISGGHAQHNDGAPSTHDAYRFRGKHMWNTCLGGADVSPGVNRGWGFTVGFCSDPSEVAWNVIANNTQSSGVAGGIRTDSDDRNSDQSQSNIDLLACRIHHNLSVNWRMGLEVRYTSGPGAPWRLPASMQFTDNEFYESDSGSTTILLGRPQGQGGTWSGNKIGGSGKLKAANGAELTQAEAEAAIASTLGAVDTTGWATAADTTLAKYLESIGYSAPNRNLEGLLAGLRALNRTAWTDNLRGSNINTWVRGRFAKPEPNYADPNGGPLGVTPPPPPPPPPPPLENAVKTVYKRPNVLPMGAGGAKQSDLSTYTMNISKFLDEELTHVNVVPSLDEDTGVLIVDMQVVARRKVDPQNGQKAIVGSTNGWLLNLCFETQEEVSLTDANEGWFVEAGNKFTVRTDSTGRVRGEFEAADWSGARVHATVVGRVCDLVTIQTGTAPLRLPASNVSAEQSTVTFAADATDASVVVTGQTWVDSSMVFFAQVVGEDALINQIGAVVTDVVDGVGYTVRAHAPNGYTGDVSVNVTGV